MRQDAREIMKAGSEIDLQKHPPDNPRAQEPSPAAPGGGKEAVPEDLRLKIERLNTQKAALLSDTVEFLEGCNEPIKIRLEIMRTLVHLMDYIERDLEYAQSAIDTILPLTHEMDRITNEKLDCELTAIEVRGEKNGI